MKEREEALESLAEELLSWAEAYPTDVFTEPTPEQIDEVCKVLGFRLDRISAMVLREFTKPWGARAKRALAVIDAPDSKKEIEDTELLKELLKCFWQRDDGHLEWGFVDDISVADKLGEEFEQQLLEIGKFTKGE